MPGSAWQQRARTRKGPAESSRPPAPQRLSLEGVRSNLSMFALKTEKEMVLNRERSEREHSGKNTNEHNGRPIRADRRPDLQRLFRLFRDPGL